MLINILQDAATESGFDLNDSADKALAIARINAAAKEIYEATDLEDSLAETLIDLMVSSNQVALPWAIDLIRGMRWATGISVDLEDQRNRYNPDSSNELWGGVKFRDLGNMPLQRAIVNQSILTFSIPKVETSDIRITVIGPTENSSRISETVTILAGTTAANTVSNFKDPLDAITKSSPTTYDITVKDVEGNILAVIPNIAENSLFRTIQVTDTDPVNNVTGQSPGLEILFKRRFFPMTSDYDTFICGDRYDKAIFWKYLEHRSRKSDEALVLSQKCWQLIGQIKRSSNAKKVIKIKFAPSPFFNPPYYCGTPSFMKETDYGRYPR